MPNMHMFTDDPIIAYIPGITLVEASYFSIAQTIDIELAELRHMDSDADLLDINVAASDELRMARSDASVAAVTYPV